MVSNPCELEFDEEITFNLFNSTIIDDLRMNSLFKMPITQNRVDVCLQQLINQKSLAPLFPMSQNVDLRKSQMLKLNEIPNFVIIPSQIGNGFAKVSIFLLIY